MCVTQSSRFVTDRMLCFLIKQFKALNTKGGCEHDSACWGNRETLSKSSDMMECFMTGGKRSSYLMNTVFVSLHLEPQLIKIRQTCVCVCEM
jgi:hypothetical protein